MARLTRRGLIAAVTPIALGVLGGRLAHGASGSEAAPSSASAATTANDSTSSMAEMTGMTGMTGMATMGTNPMEAAELAAPGGPHDLDELLIPPKPLPHQPGRVREYHLTAVESEIEVARGVRYSAWTYNGTAPGPVIRATQDDLLRVHFLNNTPHPHTIHFHGIHPVNMDGVMELVGPGDTYTYEFPARPFGMQLYHCHATPLKEHVSRGLYGAFIIDPPAPRPEADEMVMIMNGFDTDGDGDNNVYTVNGPAFYYTKYPIRVTRSRTVRIYLGNMTEFDLINSFHLHGNFFRYYRTGSTDSFDYTDTIMLCQGERGIIEIDFAYPGKFMFHAHQTEFTELGWMGLFEVVE